jgi:sigma-B regulation protein RsbU (phosphoserine phosphatase)
VPDVSKDNRYLGDSSPGRRHNQSELALPLMIGDRVIGLLNIEDDLINAFTPDDQKVLGLLAEQLTAAFENIRLHEETYENCLL